MLSELGAPEIGRIKHFLSFLSVLSSEHFEFSIIQEVLPYPGQEDVTIFKFLVLSKINPL
jgi:hypothetical protein